MKVLILLVFLSINFVSFGKEAHHNCEYPKWQNDLYSMACNIYHESRGEPLAGKMAVGFVTMNRVKSDRFPNSIKEVVYQHKQFSWFSDGRSDKVYNLDDWLVCLELATILMQMDKYRYRYYDVTEGSLFYHSNKVSPYWADPKYLVVTIDNHKFYSTDKKK